MRKVLEHCPTCGSPLHVTRMECPECGTAVEAQYDPCPFCKLRPEDSAFLQIFIKSRGNMKEVERELGVSYSAARSMLDDLLDAMGYDAGLTRELGPDPSREDILRALSMGKITKEQAARLLNNTRR